MNQPLSFLDRTAIALATACGIGLAPKAPGTFGSLPGLVVGAGIYLIAAKLSLDAPVWQRHLITAGALIVLVLIALWSIARTERVWSTHDDQRIVIDEVAGQAIAVAFVEPRWWTLAIGFALFRLLDIKKPWLIGWIDREGPGAIGTLFDDVLAGVVASLALVAMASL